MDKLFIIGNGFDIAHGLSTTYNSFKDFLTNKENGKYIKDRICFFESIRKYIPEDSLWSSFEKALTDFDYEELLDDNNCFLLDPSSDSWSDAAWHDFQYEIDKAVLFSERIPFFVREWILHIGTASIKPVINKNLFSEECYFLNFNYTDSLERIYGIPRSKILYIHGKAIEDTELIVGHHEKRYLNYRELFSREADDFRINEARESILRYFKKTYKNTEDLIIHNKNFFSSLNKVKDVYVLGHSYDWTDFDYFKEVKNSVRHNSFWNLFGYTANDQENASKMAGKLNLSNCKILAFNTLLD